MNFFHHHFHFELVYIFFDYGDWTSSGLSYSNYMPNVGLIVSKLQVCDKVDKNADTEVLKGVLCFNFFVINFKNVFAV